MGSGGVAAIHQGLPACLRTSRDVDIVPIGIPVLYYDGQIIERELGEDSAFADENLFFVDYVTPASSAARHQDGSSVSPSSSWLQDLAGTSWIHMISLITNFGQAARKTSSGSEAYLKRASFA